jgi:hypothetical protein
MAKGNNREIKIRFEKEMRFAGEQLEAVNDITWNERDEVVKEVMKLVSERLDAGAIKYNEQVPITLQECLESKRDNLVESIEEDVDSLVYSIPEVILQTQLSDSITYNLLRKANVYKFYALY